MNPGTALMAHTSKGTLQGTSANSVHVFKGVPFAKPPVGPLRFKAAEPMDSWNGVRDATAYGPAPVQVPAPGFVANPMNEDCLYLNVFAPSGPGPHPVFVWLFGGGNVMGEGGIDLYDGTEFAKRGIVLVTINYRVGALGYLNIEHLLGPEYAAASNAGLTDIVMALRWVNEEIAAFGGDRSKVTLGGESAGAKDTMTLLAGPEEVRGLFQSVILESGTAQCVWANHTTRVMADNVLRQLGLSPNEAEQLLTIDATTLVSAYEPAIECPGIAGFNIRPTIGTDLLPVSGLDAARKGSVNGLRVLIGNNHDEYDLFMAQDPVTTAPGVERMDYVATPKMAKDINDRYRELRPDLSEADLAFRIMCDEEWWIPNVRFVEALLDNGQNNEIWMFRYDFQPVGGPMKVRACHTSEIPLVFNTLSSQYAQAIIGDTPGAQELSNTMTDAWARFIKGESPGGGHLPEWPTYDLDTRRVMLLDTTSQVASDPWADLRKAWTGVQ
jgi:para-nitrobenzyl esterase